MVNEHLKLKYWTIYVTLSFGRSFVVDSRILYKEMIKRYHHLRRANWNLR